MEPTAPATSPPSNPRRLVRVFAAILRVGVVLAGIQVALVAYEIGQFFLLLLVLMFMGVVWGVLARLVLVVRGRLTLAAWRRPFDPAFRAARWQSLNRALFWVASGAVVVWTLPAALLERDVYQALVWIVVVLVVLDVGLALVPTGSRVRFAWNVLPFLGWVFLGVEACRILAGPPGPAVVLEVPFEGEWAVGQGGRSALVNHHYPIPAQSHALDLVKLSGGLACVGDDKKLESYAAFGAPLRAPAAGRVVRAVDRYPDMQIGQTDVESLVGNHVVIEIGPSRFVLFAHMQRGSLKVKEGQDVRVGDPIGRCGNSGNTSQPHLHLQVQSQAEFRSPGLRTFPMVFRGASVARSPRRNDVIVAGSP
ncbi:MAG: M23 family metallopeptidase [Isosphaeraceae bacterium]